MKSTPLLFLDPPTRVAFGSRFLSFSTAPFADVDAPARFLLNAFEFLRFRK